MKKIAVIGTGIMGSGIAANFLKHGYEVHVWNRSPEKLQPLIEKGAVAAKTPKEAVVEADIVFEVTANDKSSRLVWLEPEGIFAGAKDTILITSGTFSVEWTDAIAKLCQDAGYTYFDMPLTGSRIGAETGKLTLLVGGDEQKLELIKPDLAAISEKIMYFGKAGSGMRFKLLLNMLAAIHIAGLGEALKLAQEIGMDVTKVGNALSERPGGTTTNLAWRDYQTEPEPINFSVEWITKDLTYAKELSNNVATPLLDETLGKYQEAIEQGLSQKDWTIINKI